VRGNGGTRLEATSVRADTGRSGVFTLVQRFFITPFTLECNRKGAKMSSPAMAMEPKASVHPDLDGCVDPTHIAGLAYEFWQLRGCPIVDWFNAEVGIYFTRVALGPPL
jgi:hypothetical protein